MESKAILIVGSLNMDFVVQTASLPARGETVSGWGFQMLPGGKGANQACAVGRLGGRGEMVGCVGDDVFGLQLIASLQSAGVNTTGIRSVSEAATGIAMISIEEGGQNTIVVAAGANHQLEPHETARAVRSSQAGYLLLQLESPMATVEAAAQAKARGMMVILDPAPAEPLSESLLRNTDILTPNESEAFALLGLEGSSVSLNDAPAIARRLLDLGPRQVILKMGEKGAHLADNHSNQHYPAARVKAVDATAAGDCFNGALAVMLAEGRTVDEAIRFANCAAAVAVTRLGAQASIPTRMEVEAMMAEQNNG
ncbi:MAG TPA: ribokinase [Blastocatellia bacterium]|nr:ribokinase [Blastocatellia bacterium]